MSLAEKETRLSVVRLAANDCIKRSDGFFRSPDPEIRRTQEKAGRHVIRLELEDGLKLAESLFVMTSHVEGDSQVQQRAGIVGQRLNHIFANRNCFFEFAG